jgi:hypothetical protein
MDTRIVEKLQSKIDYAQGGLNRFATDFAQDPAHAFSWGDGVFENAAIVKVFGIVAAGIMRVKEENDGEFPEAERALFEEDCLRRALEMAERPSFSTSPTSNLMHQYEAKAWTRVYRALKGDAFY